MPATKGSAWVSGNDVHFVGEDGVHRFYTGSASGGTPVGATKGAVWVDTHLWYIDEYGNQRYVPSSVMSTVTGNIGSLWVNNQFLYWLDQLQSVRYGHSDVAGYSDHGDSIVHGDVAHSDVANTYTDYTDCIAGGIYHNYSDFSGHTDYYSNCHQDSGVRHSDVPHSDIPAYSDYGDSRAHSDFPALGATLP